MTALVGDLQNKIKEGAPTLIHFDVHLLKLYLARNERWLNLRDDDIKALLRKEVPDGIKNLMQEHHLLDGLGRLSRNNFLGKYFAPVARDIHVLVERPGILVDNSEFHSYICSSTLRLTHSSCWARSYTFAITVIMVHSGVNFRHGQSLTGEKVCVVSGCRGLWNFRCVILDS
ncbi:Crinkler (CRN) [Phytophthora megakarya]|uniref:Crinkler (CRN) n=1 Tax=Phytophthora megakarya TaxID=4795 RepID=A0A225V0E9_9STRA|nr:Crinkler (CRN) [Phytophthora megakarya]